MGEDTNWRRGQAWMANDYGRVASRHAIARGSISKRLTRNSTFPLCCDRKIRCGAASIKRFSSPARRISRSDFRNLGLLSLDLLQVNAILLRSLLGPLIILLSLGAGSWSTVKFMMQGILFVPYRVLRASTRLIREASGVAIHIFIVVGH
jgi:hypothetical protein